MKNVRKKISIGSWITLAHPSIAEIFCSAGFDWLAIDLEHSSITIREAEDLIRIINLSGVKPYVRLTSNNDDQIKRVLDSGAEGIIVPMVNSKEDVKRAIQACYYNPIGNRSVGLARAQGYGRSLDKYIKWLKKDFRLIVQIEHIDAIENLDEIFSIKQLYGYIIGPYDLSASMGIPGNFSDTSFKNNIKKINLAASKYNLNRGIHIIEPNVKTLKEKINEGFNIIGYSLDIRMLDQLCQQGIDVVKKNKKL